MPLAPGTVGDRGLHTGGPTGKERLSRLRELGDLGPPIPRSWRPQKTGHGRPVVRGGRGDRRLWVNLGPFPFRERLTQRDKEANLNAPSPPTLPPTPCFWKQHGK